MFLNSFPTILRSFEAEVFDEKCQLFLSTIHFGSVQNSLFDTFRRKFLLQMAVEWWEMNLETCSGYEKHSSGSGKYVSKNIRVIRRVERKIMQEIDETVEQDP